MTVVTGGSETGWLAEFAAAVAGDRPEDALRALQSQATAHAGTAPAAAKRAATREVVRGLARRPDGLVRWSQWMAANETDTGKELGAMLLAHSYLHHRDEALRLLQALADDGHWEVREWAGSAAGELLDRHFDEVLPEMARWAAHGSQFVRRAVAIAARGAADRRRTERCEPLFGLIEPLVSDRAEEVRRNLGPFAVGAGLLGHYPAATLERVRRWAQSDDEMARWNAAMVFAAANARKHIEPGLEILSELARDRRRLVWMAVAAALKNLARRDPERAAPEIRKWLADERKLPAALALRATRD